MSIDFDLDSSTLNYAVFGNPVEHSKSPQIHLLFAEQAGINLVYQAIEVPEDNFQDYLDSFFIQSGKGLNVTVPFKEEAYSICDVLTERAEQSASVNTIWMNNNQIYGDTTDGQGLINDLKNNHQLNLNSKQILVLGAGGSVKAILPPLVQQNPAQIVIANRTIDRAERLVEKFSGNTSIEAVSYNNLSENKFDVLINGTSLSLAGKLPPIPNNILKEHACCYDLMYSSEPTVFMRWAKEQGAAKILDGLGMLVEQAAEGFFIWHGVKPETAPVLNALRT